MATMYSTSPRCNASGLEPARWLCKLDMGAEAHHLANAPALSKLLLTTSSLEPPTSARRASLIAAIVHANKEAIPITWPNPLEALRDAVLVVIALAFGLAFVIYVDKLVPPLAAFLARFIR
eukprot:jgi/Chlat1/5298/Chrsp35S08976